MRKILLATTALVGVALAGSAQAAATSPISLNVGGYTDFVAGFFHEAPSLQAHDGEGTNRRHNRDFETEFKLNFDAMGKGSNGIEYGANVSLWNGSEVTDLLGLNTGAAPQVPFTGNQNRVTVNSAYVWLSGAFGKVLLGDEHGASDLFVYAPTVGEGQVDGRYLDFVDPFTLARFQPSGIDNTEHSTKITYYTPKVGNDTHKVQLGASYIPNLYDYGQNVIKQNNSGVLNGTNNSTYQDVVKADLAYTGNFHPVSIVATGQIQFGEAGHGPAFAAGLTQNAPTGTNPKGTAQDYVAWGIGAQAMWNGFTVGGSYNDQGRYGTVHGQDRDQNVWTLGGKYEFDKVGVAVNYLGAQGYDNMLGVATTATTVNGTNYVDSFNAWGAGATYTWFPGLTSNADGVLFTQHANQADHNSGYVLLLSQRLAF